MRFLPICSFSTLSRWCQIGVKGALGEITRTYGHSGFANSRRSRDVQEVEKRNFGNLILTLGEDQIVPFGMLKKGLIRGMWRPPRTYVSRCFLRQVIFWCATKKKLTRLVMTVLWPLRDTLRQAPGRYRDDPFSS